MIKKLLITTALLSSASCFAFGDSDVNSTDYVGFVGLQNKLIRLCVDGDQDACRAKNSIFDHIQSSGFQYGRAQDQKDYLDMLREMYKDSSKAGWNSTLAARALDAY